MRSRQERDTAQDVPRKLRVLLAEDSSIFAAILEQILEQAPDIELLPRVDNGEDAVRACAELSPDLVLMDVQMPRLDGLAATEAIMASCPTPILVITSDPFRGGVDVSFKALSAGALDLFPKDMLRYQGGDSRQELLRKIRLLAEIPVIRHVRGHRREGRSAGTRHPSRERHDTLGGGSAPGAPLVGIVASTGGPRALATILGALPANLPASLLVVQHITRGFTTHLARWLDANCAMRVVEAEDQRELEPGVIYIAPSDRHLELDVHRRLRAREGSPVSGHCPSGDVLLESLAEHGSRQAIGVVLSGMGGDGARGLQAMRQAGCETLAQDRESSVVWGMPRAAVELDAVDHVMDPDQIAEHLLRRLKRRGR